MSKKSKKTDKGDTWEWEETPETIEALKKLHATNVFMEDIRKAAEGKRHRVMGWKMTIKHTTEVWRRYYL